MSANEATKFNCHHLKHREQHQENFGVCTVLKSDAWSCFINSSGYNRDFFTDQAINYFIMSAKYRYITINIFVSRILILMLFSRCIILSVKMSSWHFFPTFNTQLHKDRVTILTATYGASCTYKPSGSNLNQTTEIRQTLQIPGQQRPD